MSEGLRAAAARRCGYKLNFAHQLSSGVRAFTVQLGEQRKDEK